MSNEFAASITPGHAGGEITRVQLLRSCNLSVGDASAVVLGERMLDALFLGIAAPIGFVLFTKYVNERRRFDSPFWRRSPSFRYTLFHPPLRHNKAKKTEVSR